MSQGEVLDYIDERPNELFDINDLRLGLNKSKTNSTTGQNLKNLRKWKFIGYVTFNFNRFYYFSLKSDKFKDVPYGYTIYGKHIASKKECMNVLKQYNLIEN